VELLGFSFWVGVERGGDDLSGAGEEGWREDWEVLRGYGVASTSPDSIKLKRSPNR